MAPIPAGPPVEEITLDEVIERLTRLKENKDPNRRFVVSVVRDPNNPLQWLTISASESV